MNTDFYNMPSIPQLLQVQFARYTDLRKSEVTVLDSYFHFPPVAIKNGLVTDVIRIQMNLPEFIANIAQVLRKPHTSPGLNFQNNQFDIICNNGS
jgi:hypothetical protein